MKTLLKIVGGLLGLVLMVGLVCMFYAQLRGIPHYAKPPVAALAASPASPTQLALSEKLVQASCADCHLNRQTNVLSGRRLLDVPKEFRTVIASNVTQGPSHDIGAYTDSEIVGLLRTGIGHDGRYRLILPHFVYVSDDDVRAVLAFLHSGHPWVKTDPTPLHPQAPSFLRKTPTNNVMKPALLVPGTQPNPATSDAVAYGRYQCYDCHAQDFKTNNAPHPEQSVGYLGGGNLLVDAQGPSIRSRNITGDTETGIGQWTAAQLAAALRGGQSPHGPPTPKYATITDAQAQAQAIYAYLQNRCPKSRKPSRPAAQ